jgi:hypothetical protein
MINMKLKTKKRRVKDLNRELDWYEPCKVVADAMRELVNDYGFEYVGHGIGGSGEDFNLWNHKHKLDVTLTQFEEGKTTACVSDCSANDCFEQDIVCSGSIKKVLKFVKSELTEL